MRSLHFPGWKIGYVLKMTVLRQIVGGLFVRGFLVSLFAAFNMRCVIKYHFYIFDLLSEVISFLRPRSININDN